MRRRLLSLCLVLCMVLGMLPMAASAMANGDITITVGEESITAEYLGQCGEKTLGAAYDCFVAEVPTGKELTVTNSAMESGSYSRKNYSGSLFVDFKEYPATLESDEVQEYVLTDEEKAELDGDPISFGDDTWAALILQDEETDNTVYVFLKLLEQETFTVTLTPGDTYTIAATQDSESPVVSGGSFSFTVYPVQGYHMKNAVVKAGDTILTAENEIYTISNITQDIVVTVEGVEEVIENQKTVTVPTGAEVHVYFQSGYSSGNGNDKEIAPVKTVSNGETVTYYYSLKSAGGSYVAFYGDKIPYAGYFDSVSDVVLSWDGETRTPAYRGDYDISTTYGARGEDSVYTNVNSNGHLVLNEEFMLRSYRGWQIINTDTANIMIEPEFNYSASNSNITVTPYNERTDSTVTASGTSSNNWVYLTPNGSGITYLEIGYDAVHIVDGNEAGAGGGAEGQPSNFTWNASDPNRTALIVVQTDGNAASDITFGIQSPSGGWDYEYDTVYFTESQGILTMVPTGDVATVSVSHDKGSSYETLTDTDGTYTVPIIPGNNIIKITDSNGKTAFQVVRGEQISYTVTNLTTGADTVSVGDSVRVTFYGLHTACPKISGIYNPGYPNTNTLGYKLNGTTVTQSEGYQYSIHNNAWIEFTAPNATCVLSGGYLDTPPSFGKTVGGLYQASAVNSSGTSSTRRNIFPEITIQVEGTQVIPAQSIKLDMQSASMGISGTLLLTETLEPLDATDEVIWSSSNEAVATVEDGTVTAHAAGKATITVTAGEASATCEIEVKDQESGSFTLNTDLYDLPADEIYVATCGLSQITVSGPVPVGEIIGGEGPEWSVNILEGTGDTVTVSMTGVSHAMAVASRRFWYNGNVSDVTLVDCTDGTFTVTLEPEWDGDTAIVTLGLGSAKKIVGDTYTITMTRVKAQEETKTYTVTLTEGEGYTIAACEGSENPVTEGGSYSFTVTVADGYEGTPVVKAGETELIAVEGVYTIENIQADQTVTVEGITKIVTYTVTLTEDEGYTISACEGSENPVKQGGSFSFTVTVNEGYEGTPVVKAGDTALTAVDGVYTIESITADQTVTVEGVEKIQTYTVTLAEGEGYTIAACEGSENPVTEGSSFSFTVTVNDGYEGIPQVMAGDTALTAVDGVYTIENINADQTVTVEGITKKTEPTVVYGDMTGDGEVDVFDASIAYSIANGKTEATEEQLAGLDVNGDGQIDVFDAAMIYSFANGKRDSFPVDKQ